MSTKTDDHGVTRYVVPQSEWDRRYAMHVARQSAAAAPRAKQKPGPKPGKPLPKVFVRRPLGEIVLTLMGEQHDTK